MSKYVIVKTAARTMAKVLNMKARPIRPLSKSADYIVILSSNESS
ncbi:MAG: hypothetical protein UT43_C0028G0008 [Parcubacteria group bacterium GW2011_GWC1_39_29]|nr:MAG: hypothetical protein UT43_C0028G0008 [Parcubacteria group bacterium GW2011_GWC1_39_29]